MPARSLPNLFPKSLRLKLDSGFQIVAPTSTGGLYLAYSLNRIDHDKVDIQPFGLVLYASGPSTRGVYIDHGQWDGRTSLLPSSYTQHVDHYGTGTFFSIHAPGGKIAGTLDELPTQHRGAFEAVVQQLRRTLKTGEPIII